MARGCRPPLAESRPTRRWSPAPSLQPGLGQEGSSHASGSRSVARGLAGGAKRTGRGGLGRGAAGSAVGGAGDDRHGPLATLASTVRATRGGARLRRRRRCPAGNRLLMTELYELSACEAVEKLVTREVSAGELLRALLERIDA